MKHMKLAVTGLLTLCLALFCMLSLPLVPGAGIQQAEAATTATAREVENAAGSFVLSASISSKTIIEPVEVFYTEGQTIKDALKNSGFEFGGIDQFYINAIENEAGNFNIYYDGGGYDLTVPASTITGILVAEREDMAEEDLELVKLMLEYLQAENHVQYYKPAQEAYANGLTGLRTTGSDATALKAALEKAIDDYKNLITPVDKPVTVTATQNGKSLSSTVITLTDEWYNEYTATGTEVLVHSGTFTFVISDGGKYSVEGSVTVDKSASLQVELPYGNWFSELKLLDENKEPYDSEVDLEAGTATFFVPDIKRKSDTNLYVGMGPGVPDEDNTKLRARYINRASREERIATPSWESRTSSLTGLVLEDCQDADFTVWAQYVGEDGYTQKVTLKCKARRVPTLTSITVNAEGTKLPLDFAPLTNDYEVATVSDSLKITVKKFISAYTVSGTGSFTISENGTSYKIKVTGTNGQVNTYTVKLDKKDSVNVTVTKPSGCSLKVYNAADSEIAAVDGVYHLIPGESYYYVTTKNTEYHAKASFKASEGLTVTAKSPDTTDALTDFALYSDFNAKSRTPIKATTTYAASTHDYTYQVSDVLSAAYGQATCATGYSAKVNYTSQSSNAITHGIAKSIDLTNVVDIEGSAKNLPQLLGKCSYSQSAEVVVSKVESGVTYYQSYRLTFNRKLHLKALSCIDPNGELVFSNSKKETIVFNRDVLEYYVSVDRSTTEITITGNFMNELTATPVCGGYCAMVGETRYDSMEEIKVALTDVLDEEVVELNICSIAEGSIPTTYTLHVIKTDPVPVTFNTTPANANVYIINNATGRHVSKVDGTYPLTPGVSYCYTVTCKDYVGQIVEAYIGPETAATVTVNLKQVEANEALIDYDAQWPSFRADDYNNGVVDGRTPVKAEDAVLSWATQLGEGYSADACGCPIIVDGYLFTYAGTHIYKVDSVSGQVVATGDMDHKSSFAINSPTYAEGMIFIGLADGTVQAFNATTMESVWIYHDPLKGQPNCPIAYHDGYIYTGFWLGEQTPANFVCLSVTDEDPANTLEEKVPVWRYKHNGYYWAGAYVCDNYVLEGTDDGKSGYTTGHASLLSIDPLTGDLIDEYVLKEPGDLRSSITFVPDSEGSMSGYAYFTTKGGYFYRIKVDSDGKLSSLKKIKLYNYASDDNNPAMSTCTPTIYNGRAYIGISGVAQFGAYSGHNITVIDLDSWSIAYTVRTQGYPQTSGLLTTAYEEETGDVLVYFFDNYTPGKLRMLRDHKGQTKPDTTVVETYIEKGEVKSYDTAYVLFTPDGAQAQYAICSPLVDEYGTIYFKNDSAYLMALTSAITKLTVVEEPYKMSYKVGESFDASGMKVEATYANGLTRDVTKYVTWSEEALTADDTEFTIEFPYVMYQNKDGEIGVPVEHPYVDLSIEVKTLEAGAPEFIWEKISDETTTVPSYKASAVFDDGAKIEATVSSEVMKEAGCESEGRIRFTATVNKDGKTYTDSKTETIPALGHDLITTEAKPATCEEVGWEAYEKCSRCDYTTYQEIPALGHSWDEGVVTKEATETEEGDMLYTCQTCQVTKTEVIPTTAHVHTLVDVALKKATWTASGKTAGTKCSNCGEILSGCKTIPKAGTPKLSTTSYTYDGKYKKPTVKISVTVSGKTSYLVSGTDYTVSYTSNKLVGTATATVKLKGNYSGSKKLTFTIKPKATAISSLKAASKAFTVTWKQVTSQATGYQIRYSTSSKMTSAKTVTVSSYKTTSKKISSLTSKKKYYVQVRTYKTVSGKKYYGAWCTKKYVTVK